MYYATVRHDGHHFGIDFVDVPGCISGGASLEEVVAGAHEALCLHLGEMALSGEPRPTPSSVAAVWARARAGAEPGEQQALVPIVVTTRRVEELGGATLRERLLASVDGFAAEHGDSAAVLRARRAIASVGAL